MDYRYSMSPRFWRTTCDNRGGIAYYADRPRSRSLDQIWQAADREAEG